MASSEIKIRPCAFIDGSHRTGRIEGLTADQISEVLGFKPNVKDDEYKVEFSWAANASGTWRVDRSERMVKSATTPIAIWDYKGSWRSKRFSTYGDAAVFERLFGKNYHAEW